MKSYKDELLQEKIDDMDQLDRIELRQLVSTRNTFRGIMSNSITILLVGFILSVFMAFTSFDRFTLLKEAGLYAASLQTLATTTMMVFGIIFLVLFTIILMNKSSKIGEELDENIDEFIRENSD